MPDPSLSPAEMGSLADICAVANTAPYLFRHFRESSAIQSLTRTHRAGDLIAYARQAAEVKPSTLTSTTQAYAGLVAAMLRPLDEFTAAMSGDTVISKIRWFNDLLQIRRGMPETNTATIVLSTSSRVTQTNAPPPQKPVGTPLGTAPKFELG